MSILQNINFKRVGKHLGLALALFFGLVFISLLFLNIYSKHNDHVLVPDLKNMKESELNEKLSALNLRYEIIDSGAYNPKIQATGVIDQNPLAGSEVKENRKIYITINPSNPGFVVFENFKDKHIRRLVGHARATQLNIETIEYKTDIADFVILDITQNGKSIPVGTKIGKKSNISVLLGKTSGKRSSIPGVIDLNLSEAKDKIWSLGLNIGAIRYDENAKNLKEDEIEIYKQSPRRTRGEIYNPGHAVSLWVRKKGSGEKEKK
ncbi:MAG: PASTA domain-containing protein [Flavobacteriales bacterium]|jgi:beta-lactam-binding protein with PASTA domain|nr:PASTA domain-containing protein [Flavobacteriales bacterium]